MYPSLTHSCGHAALSWIDTNEFVEASLLAIYDMKKYDLNPPVENELGAFGWVFHFDCGTRYKIYIIYKIYKCTKYII